MNGGLIAVNKPQGVTSAQCLNQLKAIISDSPLAKYFRSPAPHPNDRNRRRRKKHSLDIKIGHGGTLDPLASGVLVVGLGSGTKQLSKLLSCKKVYETVALFGRSTDTYDSSGKIVESAEHVPTKEEIETALPSFKGDIMQMPPIYSALHVNGKRLYEYAREGLPLPDSVKARPMHCFDVEMTKFMSKGEHTYCDPDNFFELEAAEEGAEENKDSEKKNKQGKKRKFNEVDLTRGTREPIGPAASFRLTVSSGFYVRSFVNDLGEKVNSKSHMVELVRLQQGDFELNKPGCFSMEEFHSGEWLKKLADYFKLSLDDEDQKEKDASKENASIDSKVSETAETAPDEAPVQEDTKRSKTEHE
ncbi:tRNA pseudouridine synthase [Schizosaccharomyces japonicus yFS275]|uniref:tRNA pseudouridine(55) synthase n=1 Tax=Schizosaccharomyces japonicus (strain yFS275 / FY16936) TaxID=402676 RepID=B6K5T9_SCHJY|nr:tRNA pseudouridine synthase [Schizosaccharomyces japonicus yFS275]EEB08893.1 tRNA pseudouridine synthase [Schizosaccharomyces japonicus yFS275]